MTLRLNGSTSGYTEIDAPAVAGSNTLVLPTGNGNNGQFLQTDGSGTLSWSGSLTLGTAKASTSGTSIDFSPADGTGIPSWAKRVTVMFSGVSTNGSSNIQLQIGAGSIDATGYTSRSAPASGTGTTSATGYLATSSQVAADLVNGIATLALLSANTWVYSSAFSLTNVGLQNTGSGTKTLSGTLDRVRITTVNGTDTFDAGSINIMYEG